MPFQLALPRADHTLAPYTLSEPASFPATASPAQCRRTFAAAHVVADPFSDNHPGAPASIDWEATLAYRRHLWSLGLAIAEAMDTAQRGMGLDWPATQELIRRSLAESHACNGAVACGAGTDHLTPSPDLTLDNVIAAYEEQCSFIEEHRGRIILMASRALAACAKTPDD